MSKAFDGTYRGAVQLTFIAPQTERAWCQTEPQASMQINNGILTYTQPHPGYPGGAVVTYHASVMTNASFTGESDRSGVINGNIAGNHLAARIDGIGCGYTLAADRI
jgi:hypothetical protein